MTARRLFLLSLALLSLALVPGLPGAAPGEGVVRLPGGTFTPLFGVAPGKATVTVAPFRMDARPVTNLEFRRFVLAHPEWAPGAPPPELADKTYLAHWKPAPGGALPFDPAQSRQPVVHVSWNAADAYCQAQGGRLPTVFEWEFAAAADETRPDASQDPAFAAAILAWYAAPTGAGGLPEVGRGHPDYWGLYDLHGLVWEWTHDFDSLRFGAAASRAGDAPGGLYCGGGALGSATREDYAAFMRFALRSSLEARFATAGLGFRCAYDATSR